jgi:hypothetical protein
VVSSVAQLVPAPSPDRPHGLDRFLLAECAIFHLLCAVVLAATGRWAWALVFAAAGAGAGVLLRYVTAATQLLAWYVIFPLGLIWGTALVLGIGDSAVSTLGTIAWPFLYLPWSVVAVRLALGKA